MARNFSGSFLLLLFLLDFRRPDSMLTSREGILSTDCLSAGVWAREAFESPETWRLWAFLSFSASLAMARGSFFSYDAMLGWMLKGLDVVTYGDVDIMLVIWEMRRANKFRYS